MNKEKLKKEGKKWLDEDIINEQQLEAILAKYEKKDQSYLLIVFAALLISLGILIFIFSDWAQVPQLSRTIMMVLLMLALYVLGAYLYRKQPIGKTNKRNQIIGISFIVLGYILFGATLFLTFYMYDVRVYSAWPFVIWSLVGLFLYMTIPNVFLFTVALLITIYGQIHSGINFSTFDYLIFIIFMLGYFHYVFHRGNTVVHYVFAIGLAIQFTVLTTTAFTQTYWFILFVLFMYGLGLIIPKSALKRTLVFISIFTMFIYKIFETISVQQSYFKDGLVLQPLFFILWAMLIIGVIAYLWHHQKKELITVLLFMPFFFLPYAFIFIIISLFIYSIYWLIYGFQAEDDEKIMLGMIGFLFSTFIVFIQFAWETLNKSIFFVVAGILLFMISALFERRRRKTGKGDESK